MIFFKKGGVNKLGWEEILKRPFDYPDEDRLSSGMKDYIRNWAKETFDTLLRDGKKTILIDFGHDRANEFEEILLALVKLNDISERDGLKLAAKFLGEMYNHDIIVTVDRRGYLFKW